MVDNNNYNSFINKKKRKCNVNELDDVSKGKIIKKRKKKIDHNNDLGKCIEEFCNNKMKYKKTSLCDYHSRQLRNAINTIENSRCILKPCTNNIKRSYLCQKHYTIFLTWRKDNNIKTTCRNDTSDNVKKFIYYFKSKKK